MNAHETIDSLDPDAFRKLYQLIERRAKPLRRPFSLCELGWTPAERCWMRHWPERVTAGALKSALQNTDRDQGFSSADAAGLALLLAATEVGREFALSGEIWPIFRQKFPAATRDLLFVQKQPRWPARWALEQACRRLGLRHAFDLEAVQAYYLTIYLQFGFGRQSLERVPLWIAIPQSRPKAVSMLIEQSEEFSDLWQRLERWLESKATQDDLAAIQRSSFVPEDWLPLIKASEPVRTTPYLYWQWEKVPKAVISLSSLYSDLEDGDYFLTIEGVDHLVHKAGARFDPAEIQLSAKSPVVHPVMEPLDPSSPTDSRSLQLWDDSQELQLLDPSRGHSLRRVPNSSFWLIAARDFQVDGAARWFSFGDRHRLYEFASPPSGAFIRSPEGDDVVLEAPPGVQPLESAKLSLLPGGPSRLGSTVRAWVDGVGAVPGQYSYYQRERPLSPRPSGSGSVELSLELPLDHKKSEVNVTVRGRIQGRLYTKTLSSPLKIKDATWLAPAGWERFRVVELEVSEVKHRPVRLFYPPDEYVIAEGTTIIGRPEGQDQFLNRLAGYGAPLKLVKGPYNQSGEGDVMLAKTLVNRGILSSLTRQGKFLQLDLRRPIELDDDHFLLWWNGGSQVRVTTPDGEERTQRIEALIPPGFERGRLCVALGYGESRLGCVWTDCFGPGEVTCWREAARLLRWLQLPLLQEDWWLRWGAPLRQNWYSVVEAWSDDSPCVFDGRATQHAERVEFAQVFRKLVVEEIDIKATPAQKLLDRSSFVNWVHMDPRFAIRLVRHYQREETEDLLKRTFNYAGRHEPLLKLASAGLQVDDRFLEKLWQASFCADNDSVQVFERDLEFALNHAPFQEYVVCRTLWRDICQD